MNSSGTFYIFIMCCCRFNCNLHLRSYHICESLALRLGLLRRNKSHAAKTCRQHKVPLDRRPERYLRIFEGVNSVTTPDIFLGISLSLIFSDYYSAFSQILYRVWNNLQCSVVPGLSMLSFFFEEEPPSPRSIV